ncbi:hypothetical protein Tco_1381298 [Tanacetum coccineum]
MASLRRPDTGQGNHTGVPEMQEWLDILANIKDVISRYEFGNHRMAFLPLGDKHRWTPTTYSRRFKILNHSGRALHQMGGSQTIGINNGKPVGKVCMGTHNLQV